MWGEYCEKAPIIHNAGYSEQLLEGLPSGTQEDKEILG